MSDGRKISCPHCGADIGQPAPQGGVRMTGIAATLVKADGTVYGPCKSCRKDIVISSGGEAADLVKSAMPSPQRRRVREVILVIEDTGSD